MKKAIRLAAAVLLLVMLSVLCGCSFRLVVPPEELYQLPDLPAEYTALGDRIRELLDYGMEYAPPVSGAATQNVQLVDLSGDGEQEAVVFLRSPTEEQPLRIHIFAPVEDGYTQTAVLSGSGTDIYSFNGRDLDGDGKLELLVGWQTGSRLRGLTVYALRDAGPVELLRTGYAKYAVEDLNGDGAGELVVIRTDDAGRCAADLYVCGERLEKVSSARMSVTPEELAAGSMTSGFLRDGTPAIFAAGVSVHDGYDVLVSDILCLRDGVLTALTESEYTGITKEVFRYWGLLPEDINGDVVTEVPAPVLLEGDGENYRIDWYAYGRAGLRHLAASTYHDLADGWYLELPGDWAGRFTVSRSRSGGGEMAVTFSVRGREGISLLQICTITGSDRAEKAAQGNRFVLARQPDVIYTGELLGGGKETMTADELRAGFHLISRRWAAGDN